MTETKNLNHTFSSDVTMPLYLIFICFGSLYPLNNSVTDFFFFFFWGGGGEWGGCGHMFTIP